MLFVSTGIITAAAATHYFPLELKPRSHMDIPNAFLGKATQPTNDEVATALGPSAPVWGELLDWLAKEKGVSDHDWKSSSPKYG
jgi:hypothetical protein